MWVQELGVLDVGAQRDIPETDSYSAKTVAIETAFGAVTSLAPPLEFTNLTMTHQVRPRSPTRRTRAQRRAGA
jgi:hypothetical protein